MRRRSAVADRARPARRQRAEGGLALSALAPGRLENPLRGRRIVCELASRAARPRNQLTAAVRTLPSKNPLRASPAEGAFEGTDESVAALGRQVAVAALAVRPELEHRNSHRAAGARLEMYSATSSTSRGESGCAAMVMLPSRSARVWSLNARI